MERPFGKLFASRSTVAARRGMVASSQPLATQLGLATLARGGSAVDAAIAVNAALGLMEPTGCGIGGDLFAMIRHKGSMFGLNGSGRSPRRLTRDHLLLAGRTAMPAAGPLSVSVPGTVDAWFALHERFGRLHISDILQPVIDYARAGFPLSEIIAGYWRTNARRLSHFPGVAALYMPDGHPPAAGDVFRNPELAAAYELIAAGGRDAFYEGAIAMSIDRQMRAMGGFLGKDDLSAHRSEWVTPLSTSYRGHEVWQLPPNTQGLAVLQMLNIMEGWDVAAMGRDSPQYLHLLIEAKKLAFEDRARHYADPDFYDMPATELLSPAYTAMQRARVNPGRASVMPAAGESSAMKSGDTVYLTTADENGMMVSLIQSNFRGMGSGVVVPGFGFMLQNRGELFALDPAHANVYAAGKRPFNTTIPGFVTGADGFALSFGVMGADMQPQGQVQILQSIVDFGYNVQEAGDAPRLRHDGSSAPTGEIGCGAGTVHLESGFPRSTVNGLRALGHQIEPDNGYGFGGYQAILYDGRRGVYFGASEARKDGHAAGF